MQKYVQRGWAGNFLYFIYSRECIFIPNLLGVLTVVSNFLYVD